MEYKVLVWNSHSIRNKFTELSILVDRLSIDIILISESWLTDKDNFILPNFTIYRADRSRGGCAILIKSIIPHFGFEKIQSNYAEACTISIYVDNQVVKISSIYCSPSSSRSQSKSFFERIVTKPGPHIIAGDYNCKNIEWNNASNDHKGIDLYHLLDHHNYSIYPPNEPTLYPYVGDPSCVDFVVSKQFHQLSQVNVLNDLSSDHLPLSFSIFCNARAAESQLPLNLSKTNWPKFRKLVEIGCNNLTYNNLSSAPFIDTVISQVNNIITESLSCSSPRRKPLMLRYNYSETVKNLIQNRNFYRNLFKRSRDPAFKSSVNLLNRLIRQHVRTEKLKQFEDKLCSLSYADNSLFRHVKSSKRKRHVIPPLKVNDTLVYSSKDKAEVLAQNFQNSFSITLNSSSKFQTIVDSSVQTLSTLSCQVLDNIIESEVCSVLKSLKPNKACGLDNIPNRALSSLCSSQCFVSLLTGIFNACLNLCYFPSTWKIAKIHPIPKSSKNSSSPDDFRPISLLSCLGKCFEKLILNRLSDFECDNKIIIKEQCGFRSQLSTVHQILRIVEKASFGFNNNKSTGIVLLDLRKAFDSVWHEGLIHKLCSYNYPTYLIKIINSYLFNRTAFVSVDSTDSAHFDVLSGVPQGSLIAPHLFNLFINDIPIPRKGHLSLFADDTAYFIEVPWKNLKGLKNELLNTLNVLQSYFTDWKISLNDSKTEFSVFSKSTKMIKKMEDDTIVFNGKSFRWQKSVKYLGVFLDNKLTFKQHIDHSLSKAKALCFSVLYCLLKRNSPASFDSKLRIYKAYVRPILTYGCPVFANSAKCHINKLQLLQNKVLRMIFNTHWQDFTSTNELHDSCKLPLITDFIKLLTKRFYSRVVSLDNELYSTLGQYSQESLSFRVKHKLPKSFA